MRIRFLAGHPLTGVPIVSYGSRDPETCCRGEGHHGLVGIMFKKAASLAEILYPVSSIQYQVSSICHHTSKGNDVSRMKHLDPGTGL
jgi:hypothetical protein